jgi:hypothetical protein
MFKKGNHIMPLQDNSLSTKPSANQPIFKMLDQVMLQVQYNGFARLNSKFKWIHPFYYELCMIIAEVLVMNRDSVLKINGNLISASIVQEIYSQLRNRHVCLVFDNFQNVSQKVFNKKAYLRTALYNAFFEYESYLVNNMLQLD